MPRFFKSLIHVLAAISIYIIMVVGLGWFWTIGESGNYERINSLLINLSYSFLTGYLVYLFTVYLPLKRRSRRINLIVADKLNSIVDERITPCLTVILQPEEYLNSHSDQDFIELFEKRDLLKESFSLITMQNCPIIDSICKGGELFIQDIDNIIKDYGQDLSEDTLKWFERLKKDEGYLNCQVYKGRIAYLSIAYGQDGFNIAEENRRIAERLLKLRDNILTYTKKYCSTMKKKESPKMSNHFHADFDIDKKDVQNAFNAQIKDKWSFFDERLHMEKVFSQRVNFVLLLFPVLVAAFCSVEGKLEKLIISIAGVVSLLAFYIPLRRTFFKLDIIQQITYEIKMNESVNNNPIKFIDNCFDQLSRFKRFPDNSSYSIIMWGIVCMIIALAVLGILTVFNVF